MTNEEIYTALTDLKINISAYRAETTAQNCITNAALGGINTHLAKINGSVERHERIIADRAIVVKDFEDFKESFKEVPTQIRALEDNQLSNKAVRKWVVASIGITATVVSIIFTIVDYFMKAN